MAEGSGRTCSVEGCGKPFLANGYCAAHNRRYKLYGHPLAVAPKRPRRVCQVDGCEETHQARGYCNPHYQRFLRHGDPLGVPKPRSVRSLDDLRKHGAETVAPRHRPELGPCFEWQRSRIPEGYGRTWFDGRLWLVHRLAYTFVHGYVMDGIQVNHRCDNPACFRLAHLKLGTDKENSADRTRRNR